MKNDITQKLQLNKAKLLLRKTLKVCEWEGSHGNLLLDPEHRAQINQKEPYFKGSEQGKLLNEIYHFLNGKVELNA